MSPGSSSVSPASAFLLILAASSAIAGGKPTSGSCNPRCCASLDVALLQEYVSGLNVTDSPLPRVEDAGSEDELLPFGALASDWTRLLLLQTRQSNDGPLRDNLLRLSRLMLAAYFDSQEIGNWSALLNSTGEREAAGRQEGITTLGSSESGGKANDQQAHNATLDSTGQKESTWINAESSISTTSDNATSEPRREKSHPENPATSPVFSLPANETSGRASGDNAGRSGSAGPGQKDVQPGEQQQRPRLASSMELASAEGNEALHQRSKEDYLASRLQAKVAGLLDAPEELEAGAGNHIKSVERFFALDVNNSGSGSYDEPSDEALSLEFNSTKSIEEFFASAETTTTTTRSGLSMKSEAQSLGPSSVEAFSATEISGPANGTEAPEEAETRGSSEAERITASLEDLFEPSSESNYGLLSASLEAFFNTDNPKTLLGANEETTLPADETTTTTQLAENATAMTIDRSPTSLEADPLNTKNATLAEPEEESRATARPDDLFKEKPSQDDWQPTRSAGSIDPADYSSLEAGAVPTHPLLRRMLTSFRHEPTIEPAEFGKLREPATSYREEPETTDSWERAIGKSLNLASSRSKRTSPGMNKRKPRELGERQYRSF